ncbi:MAG: glycosyltransferase family 4 protein, partial [Acidobacteriota bacterium]|nr:glycosyltransferase family 4 protein [Acidobacteriota bacterium]
MPFTFGVAERFWLDLARALNEHTPHEVELLKVPSPEGNFWEVLASYRRFFELDLSIFDAVISSKYPAWMVRHPNHILYMQHKLRGLYDTYPAHLPTAWPDCRELAELGRLVAEPNPTPAEAEALFALLETWRERGGERNWFAFPGPVTRAVVHFLDRVALRPEAIRRYGAISRTVAERADYFPPGVEVHVAHHPSGLAVSPRPMSAGPVLFTASRLDGPKRIGLIIRAFRRVTGPVRLEIAGSGPEEQALLALAAGDERIRFLGRISDAELVQAYARARAVVFTPFQEDLGLITLEAMNAARPVITCSDSGGPLEFVEDGVTGRVVAPEPAAVAAAIESLWADRR